MVYEEYLDKLKRGIFEVTFNKVNGDQRIMTCTLHPKALPPAPVVKEDSQTQKKERPVNPEVCSVWDVNAKGWRSFRVNNVTNFLRKGGVCSCGKTESEIGVCDGSHSKK